jgi:hypothetical protein
MKKADWKINRIFLKCPLEGRDIVGQNVNSTITNILSTQVGDRMQRRAK